MQNPASQTPALGRGIATTGRLNPDGVALAFANLQRFVALARALVVDHLAIIATAAVREAEDGADFAAQMRTNEQLFSAGIDYSFPLSKTRRATFRAAHA